MSGINGENENENENENSKKTELGLHGLFLETLTIFQIKLHTTIHFEFHVTTEVSGQDLRSPFYPEYSSKTRIKFFKFNLK